jgi:hypothetical protein
VLAGVLAVFLFVGLAAAGLFILIIRPGVARLTAIRPVATSPVASAHEPASASVSASISPPPPVSVAIDPPLIASSAPALSVNVPSKGHGRPSVPPTCNPPYTIGPPPDYIRKPKLDCLSQ